MQALQAECASHGWLTGQRNIQALDDDLKDLQAKVAASSTLRAKLALLKYSLDLQLWRRGSVNENALALLHAHVEYLMTLLGCQEHEDHFSDDDDNGWHSSALPVAVG